MRLAVSANAGTSGLSIGQAKLCRAALLALAAFLIAVTVATPNAAQNTTDDVHVAPRKPPDAPKDPREGIDPALKTHTKPIKVDVTGKPVSEANSRNAKLALGPALMMPPPV